ncbi:hypothetical protein J6590_079204 [Homalodisca vitripennis]|nr:hypothetical protein J6590_079204 [Homalodisca vitripennis]
MKVCSGQRNRAVSRTLLSETSANGHGLAAEPTPDVITSHVLCLTSMKVCSGQRNRAVSRTLLSETLQLTAPGWLQSQHLTSSLHTSYV